MDATSAGPVPRFAWVALDHVSRITVQRIPGELAHVLSMRHVSKEVLDKFITGMKGRGAKSHFAPSLLKVDG